MITTTALSSKRIVIILLLAEAIAVTVPVILLGKYFNFPTILRSPGETAFELFRKNHLQIEIGYYIFLISSLLYMPLSFAIGKLLESPTVNRVWISALTGLGTATTIFQSIGFIRWIFTMPFLTETYFNHPENKQTILLLYEMLNRYAGMSIGEHLGFLAMGSWTIVVGVLLYGKQKLKKWLGIFGCLIGVVLLLSVGEHFGGQSAALFGMLNFLANTLWTVWILALAIVLWLSKCAFEDIGKDGRNTTSVK